MKIETPLILYEKPEIDDFFQKYTDPRRAIITYEVSLRVYYRTILSEQQNHKCCWCGIRMTDERNKSYSSTIEHIMPKVKGGENDPDNYAVACYRCNNIRKVMDVYRFMNKIDNMRRNPKYNSYFKRSG